MGRCWPLFHFWLREKVTIIVTTEYVGAATGTLREELPAAVRRCLFCGLSRAVWVQHDRRLP